MFVSHFYVSLGKIQDPQQTANNITKQTEKKKRILTECLIPKVVVYHEKYVRKPTALLYIYENKFRSC